MAIMMLTEEHEKSKSSSGARLASFSISVRPRPRNSLLAIAFIITTFEAIAMPPDESRSNARAFGSSAPYGAVGVYLPSNSASTSCNLPEMPPFTNYNQSHNSSLDATQSIESQKLSQGSKRVKRDDSFAPSDQHFIDEAVGFYSVHDQPILFGSGGTLYGDLNPGSDGLGQTFAASPQSYQRVSFPNSQLNLEHELDNTLTIVFKDACGQYHCKPCKRLFDTEDEARFVLDRFIAGHFLFARSLTVTRSHLQKLHRTNFPLFFCPLNTCERHAAQTPEKPFKRKDNAKRHLIDTHKQQLLEDFLGTPEVIEVKSKEDLAYWKR